MLLLSVVHHGCVSVAGGHIIKGDMAPDSRVKKREGEGHHIAHLDVIHCSSVVGCHMATVSHVKKGEGGRESCWLTLTLSMVHRCCVSSFVCS